MMIKSVFWWRKPEYPEETTDLRQVTDETSLTGTRFLSTCMLKDAEQDVTSLQIAQSVCGALMNVPPGEDGRRPAAWRKIC